jgi:2-amino-4-hydroxy-6-hydroxymethyldihydropteridine diphosphokinase
MKTFIALGSNLGDRREALVRALDFLREISVEGYLRPATPIETDPVDCPPGSHPFLNTVAEIDWKGTARELMYLLQEWERTEGRPQVRPVNAPRPIDLDIIVFGDRQIQEPDLIVPHPRAHLRQFVLEPLAELAPDLILPGQEKTVRTLLAELPG